MARETEDFDRLAAQIKEAAPQEQGIGMGGVIDSFCGISDKGLEMLSYLSRMLGWVPGGKKYSSMCDTLERLIGSVNGAFCEGEQ